MNDPVTLEVAFLSYYSGLGLQFFFSFDLRYCRLRYAVGLSTKFHLYYGSTEHRAKRTITWYALDPLTTAMLVHIPDMCSVLCERWVNY